MLKHELFLGFLRIKTNIKLKQEMCDRLIKIQYF